jgi:glycosyltransferase involved in cell wall biosynthesis
MKAVLLLKSDYERAGGPETLLRGMATTIDRDRFEPTLAMLRKPDMEPVTHYPNCLSQVELPWRGIAGLPATARRAAAIAREINAAVVHSHDMRANAVAAAMRLFHPLPWIAHVHGWLGETHRGRWRVYEAIDRRLVRVADRVLVGSRAAQQEVRGCGVRHVDVVPNAVAIVDASALDKDTTAVRTEIGAPNGAVVIGMVGRLHACKGHDIFLKAFAKLIQSGLDVHGLIVGEGPESATLRVLAGTLGIADHVAFTGFVPDAHPWLAAMDIVAVPSIQDSLPLTALEAMSYARPIVTSSAGDLPVAIEDGVSGFVVPIGDVDALARCLAVLAGNPTLRRRMGAAGRVRAADVYSADAMARRLEEQYESVIAASTANAR